MIPSAQDVTRPAEPIQWPAGKRAAAVWGFDMDAESAMLAINPENCRRLSVMSHQAYDPVTDVPRILAVLLCANCARHFSALDPRRNGIPIWSAGSSTMGTRLPITATCTKRSKE